MPADALPGRALPGRALPGLEPEWSRLVTAAGGDWHLLDNASSLRRRGAGVDEVAGTVLAVHGNPTWSYLWRRMLAAGAEAGWRVIAVDQLGMGFSSRDGKARILPDRVRELGALTDALAADDVADGGEPVTGPIVTLGHDWGGVVSLGWAIDHPERLAAVLLLNTAVHQPEGEPIPAALRLALRPALVRRSTVATPAFLETTLALAHPPLAREVARAYRAPYRGAAVREAIGDFVADIPVAGAHPSWAELDRIAEGVRLLDVPALAVWGPEDPIFSDRYLGDLMARMRRLDVHRVEGAGHLIAEDTAYEALMVRWLGVALGGSEAAGPRGPDSDTAPSAPAPSPGRGDGSEPAAHPARVPLWAQLDGRRDDPGPALVEVAQDRRVSWRLLARRVEQLAAGLRVSGVRAGDRVSLLVPPGADLTAVLYACLRIGATVVVADAGLGAQGLTRAVRGARPDVLVGTRTALAAARLYGWPGRRISVDRLPAPLRAALRVETSLPELVELADVGEAGAAVAGTAGSTRTPELLPEPGPDDVAAVLFTSGSTGPAKGVVYLHRQLEALRDRLAATYGIGPESALVAGFAPFALLGPALGATSAVPAIDVTAPATLTAALLAQAIEAVDADAVFASPAALRTVVETASAASPAARAALARPRLLLSAGAPIPVELLEGAVAVLPNATAHAPYGMTEALLVTDVTLDGIRLAESEEPGARGVCVGVPGDGIEVRVAPLDTRGEATGALTEEPGVTGEIVIAAPHAKHAYDRLWGAQHESARDSDRAAGDPVGDPDGAGTARHRTSDVGHLDASGRLWIEGRLAHVVTTADGPVTPVGVERAAERAAGAALAAAVGVGPVGAQALVVVLQRAGSRGGLADPVTTDAVRAAVRDAIGRPVAAVLQVSELPTDIRHRSKIDRARVAVWAARVLDGGRVPPL